MDKHDRSEIDIQMLYDNPILLMEQGRKIRSQMFCDFLLSFFSFIGKSIKLVFAKNPYDVEEDEFHNEKDIAVR